VEDTEQESVDIIVEKRTGEWGTQRWEKKNPDVMPGLK
jgi:hypothetical protein